MKEKEQKGIEMELTVTFDNKEALKEFIDNFGKSLDKKQAEALKDLAKEQFGDDKEPEACHPQKGEIWAYLNEDGEPEALFRSSGKNFTDEKGNVMYDADKSVGLSGNVMKPFMIVTGEEQIFPSEDCRKATEKEVACFSTLIQKAQKEEGGKWETGDIVYVVGSSTGCCKVFYPFPSTYANTKTMENLANRGWLFKSEEECQALCDKLNEAIKNVK